MSTKAELEELFELYNEDCFDTLARIETDSVDMVLTDPPYGISKFEWDSVIPLKPLWEELKRIVKPNRVIAIMSNQPFTSLLIMSNTSMFKYCWIWVKNRPFGFVVAKSRPMTIYEEIVIFSTGGCASNSRAENRMTYNPQGVIETPYRELGYHKRQQKEFLDSSFGRYVQTHTNFPHNVVSFNVVESHRLHPTQKPADLLEFFVRTYTDEGDTVLDYAMGSGTTGVACAKTDRRFIGCDNDLDHGYFEIAKWKVTEAYERCALSTLSNEEGASP